MDKYEYNLKIEQIKKFLESGNYKEAELLADSINWNKIRNVNILVKIGEVYERAERYEESREILLNAYDRSPIGKNILYRLTELAIKMKDFDAAMEYYQEFLEIAPYDTEKYILKYQLMQAQEAPLPELILILEEFKEQEYLEEWAYELAYLYHKNGEAEKCVEACDELELWFGDGAYVEKALELKLLFQPLTGVQEEKYKEFCHRREGKTEIRPQEMERAGECVHHSVVIPQVTLNPERFNTVNLQEEIVKGMQELIENAEENNDVETIEVIRKLTEQKQVQPENDLKEVNESHVVVSQNQLYQVLREDADGQFCFILHEKAILEGQIIGQRSIADVLEELEQKQENSNVKDTEEDKIQQAESEVSNKTNQETEFEISNETSQQTEFEKSNESSRQTEFEESNESSRQTEFEALNETSQQTEFEIKDKNLKKKTKHTVIKPGKVNTFQISGNIMERLTDVIPKWRKGMISKGKIKKEKKKKPEVLQLKEYESILTKEQKKIFSYFVPVHGMEKQLGKALDGIITRLLAKDTAATGNLIIQGNKGCGKTVLATSIVKVLQKEGVFENGKVGKIEAKALNKKDIRQLLQRVSGGCLIIESAGELEQVTAITLSYLLEQDRSGIVVVLEDTEAGIKRAISQDARFASRFTEIITVPIFTNDELVLFAKAYANELGYMIDTVAILALHNRISSIEKVDQETRLEEVKEIIDEAIKKEATSGIRKAFNILTAKRYTDDEKIVLTEKDFE